MSHWRKYKNDFLSSPDQNLLFRAIENLGYNVIPAIKCISNSYGEQSVDFAFHMRDRAISLGGKFLQDGSLEIRGDFFLTGIKESSFMNALAQQYNREKFVERIESNYQFSLEEETVNAQGEIELRVTCNS